MNEVGLDDDDKKVPTVSIPEKGIPGQEEKREKRKALVKLAKVKKAQEEEQKASGSK